MKHNCVSSVDLAFFQFEVDLFFFSCMCLSVFLTIQENESFKLCCCIIVSNTVFMIICLNVIITGYICAVKNSICYCEYRAYCTNCSGLLVVILIIIMISLLIFIACAVNVITVRKTTLYIKQSRARSNWIYPSH